MIVLLDLNYTLVGNSRATARIRPWDRKIANEVYRVPLIELVKGHHVILITARPEYQREATLKRILSLTGWEPDEALFNEIDGSPPAWKEQALNEYVFPAHGKPPETAYFALESNKDTIAMYARYGIMASKVIFSAATDLSPKTQTGLFDEENPVGPKWAFEGDNKMPEEAE